MSNTFVYSFADATGLTKYVDNIGDFISSGTWASDGTYSAQPLNAVTYGDALYMCIIDNVGDNPQRVPTEEEPQSWSIMSLLYEYLPPPPSADAAYELAGSAFELAGSAYDLAGDAYDLAQTGTNIAWDAYYLAQIGTNTGSAAYDLAQSGSNVAWAAWEMAQIGTEIPPLSTLPDVYIPTPTDNQVLVFADGTWVAGDSPSHTSAAAFTYFTDQVASGTEDYLDAVPSPSGQAELAIELAVGGGFGPFVPARNFITGYLNRSILEGGVWQFNTFGECNVASRPFVAVTDVFLRHIDGSETYLFSGTTAPYNSTSIQSQTAFTSQSTQACVLTDKLVFKYFVMRESGPSTVATFYSAGSIHDSHIITPLGYAHNDLFGLQGGAADQFYHTTYDQNQALQGTDGDPSNINRYVTASDLASQISIEQGTRSQEDQFLQNQISATNTDLIIEQGTRSQEDQFLQTQIDTEEATRAQEDQVLQNEITVVNSLAQSAYDLASAVAPNSTGNRLISGGNAVWISGYTFRVEATTVDFNGTFVDFPQTDTTLAPSDPTDNRLDLILVDKASELIVNITGTASTPPAFPDYDPANQFELTFVPVDASTTEPSGVTRTWIYQENIEWTWDGSPTVNPNSTTNPYEGTKDIEGTSVINNQYFRLTAPVEFDSASYDVVYFYIAPKAGWGTRYLRLNWEATNGQRKGGYVTLTNGSFGFDTSNTGYQFVTIPMSLFAISSGTDIQRLRFQTLSSAGSMGYYVDNIGLQIGVPAPALTIPDATTSTKGIVLLSENGGTTPGEVVQANDYRLSYNLNGVGSPVGVVTPGAINQFYTDRTNVPLPTLWQATGTTSANWQQLT